MAFFDMSLEDLKTYKPERHEPEDYDAFWSRSLKEARVYPLDPVFEKVDSGLKLVDVYDVDYCGYGGQRIKGWYIRPAGVTSPLPCVIEFLGYGGGRGYPHNYLLWSNAGYAHFVMDTRGQGSVWRKGDTADLLDGANPFSPGFMTQGILKPETYYFRRVFIDAYRAVEAVLSREDTDASRIAVTGGSQGGGITLAAAALANQMVSVCMPDVPFLCHYRRAIGLTDEYPYGEVVQYLSVHRTRKEQVFRTLDYFDGLNFAPRIKASCYFSTGLMDMICPPSTVFAVHNHVNSPKKIEVHDFNQHEGGDEEHTIRRMAYLKGMWG